MSARAPRRTFASPFVVTLAATLPLAACVAQTRPIPAQAPSATGPEVRDHRGTDTAVSDDGGPRDHRGDHHGAAPTEATAGTGGTATPGAMVNPPRPTGQTPATQPVGGVRPPVSSTTTAGVAQPPTTKPVLVGHTPKPPVAASYDRRWLITKSGQTCQAHIEVACKPGASCNPPPPTAVACPTGITTSAGINIVLRAGQTECWTEPKAPTCPPNTMCNPPRPQKVACPT